MENAVEYNKLAISDVRYLLSQIISTESVSVPLETNNTGEVFSKFVDIVNLYNAIEEDTLSMVKEVDKMLEDVLAAVNEIESS